MDFSIWTWACGQLKPTTGRRMTLKNMSPQWVVHLSLRYSQVTLVSEYPFCQLSINLNMDVHKDVHYQVKHRWYMPEHLTRNAWSLQENSQSERAHYCCHIINTLNDSSLGKQLILFPDTLKNIRIRNFEARNPLNLAVTGVVGQHSRVTVHGYPLTVARS